jgi:2-polyprenyl-6-methoxyphenol hydroxylase-like FAD-dependent oxidoreductase
MGAQAYACRPLQELGNDVDCPFLAPGNRHIRRFRPHSRRGWSLVKSPTSPHRDDTPLQFNLAEMIGTGTYSASGEKKALMVQRGSLDSARMYLMIQSPNPEDEAYLSTSGLSSLSPSALKERLMSSSELFGSWGEEIKELISAGCDSELEAGDEISAKPLYMLPPGFSWSHIPGATLVGDAAHLTTPFAGEGVNAAMLDALELAESIISAFKAGTSVDQAVEEYETKLFPRAKDIAEETWRNLQMIFADDAPDGFVQAMMSYGPPPDSE